MDGWMDHDKNIGSNVGMQEIDGQMGKLGRREICVDFFVCVCVFVSFKVSYT